jgi:hypothetical protein
MQQSSWYGRGSKEVGEATEDFVAGLPFQPAITYGSAIQKGRMPVFMQPVSSPISQEDSVEP